MTRPLVVCSLESWDSVWRRNQFLVAGLLERDPDLEVLFVEPSSDPVHDLRAGRRPTRARGLRTVAEVAEGRLHTLQLSKPLPRAAGPLADVLLRRGVRRAVRRLGWSRPALWVNDPGWADLVPATGWPALYDITDDWLAADRGEREHDRLVAREEVLMAHCRAVVVCSPGLARTKGVRRPVVLVPNAVDTARYRGLATRPADLPAGPTVVYVGTLHEDRLDVDAVRATARALRAGHPTGTVVLVGPNALSAGHAAALVLEPGVEVLGARPHQAVPAYLQHATVLLVPHVVDDFTDSLDPIKLYEYRAAGRPVVSTPVAGFRDLVDPLVDVVPAADLPAAVVARVTSTPPPGAVPPVVPSDVPDWADRVAAMAEVLDRL